MLCKLTDIPVGQMHGHTLPDHMMNAADHKMAGIKYNFLAEPDNVLMCAICLEVAEEPRQHEKCGKLFCSECLEKYGRKRPCPNCREENPQYFGDSRSKLQSYS